MYNAVMSSENDPKYPDDCYLSGTEGDWTVQINNGKWTIRAEMIKYFRHQDLGKGGCLINNFIKMVEDASTDNSYGTKKFIHLGNCNQCGRSMRLIAEPPSSEWKRLALHGVVIYKLPK